MERLKHPIPDGSTIVNPIGKSWVASRFLIVEEGGSAKRRCSYLDCGKEYSRGTSHMILKRHWSRQHNDHFSESSIRLINRSNSPNAIEINDRRNKKRPLTTNNTSSPRKIPNSKNKSLDQTSNSTINKSVNFDKAQLDVKLVAKRLKEATSIHLTLDIHTPKKGGKTYGIITAHSLSDTLEIRSVLLEYKHLPYPDDSATVYEFLRLCITKFNIREKTVSLASNCSDTITMAVQELDKRYRISKNFNFDSIHIKCFPQFVHFNVMEILKSQESLIDNIRKVVVFTNNNNISIRSLQQSDTGQSTTVENVNNSIGDANTGTMGQKSLKLPHDNKSSWNTTYNMIETFFQQRAFVEPTLLYFQNSHDQTDVNIDWDRLYTLIQLLKPFHEVINKFATENYTPVSLVAVCIPHLMDHLSNTSWAYDDLILTAHNFKMQLESYRQEFQSNLTVIAGLLDPRVKDTFVSPEGRDDAIEILRKRVNHTSLTKNETQILHQYSGDSLWSRIFRPYEYDEIMDYLESPREHGYASNNAYWEAHKFVYPSLYTLAKTLACVQATSVPGDRMFSAAENIDRERKTKMESTNSKELMKSWAKYLEK